MSGIILGVLSKLAVTGATSGVKHLLEEPAVSKAMRGATKATAAEFVELEGVTEYLRIWCGSAEFSAVLERLRDGRRGVQPHHVVSSFIAATGFYLGKQTRPIAREILETFTRKLEAEIYKSVDGIPLSAAREEALHSETRKMVGRALKSNAGEKQKFQKTRKRFVEKVAAIYREFANSLLLGGDSIYHHQTLTADVERAEKLSESGVERTFWYCVGLAEDILGRLGTLSNIAANACSVLEHLRRPFGPALSARLSTDFDGMIESLEEMLRIAPPHARPNYEGMKRGAKVPLTIADLGHYVTQMAELDRSFRRLVASVAGGRLAAQKELWVSEEGVMGDIEWYRRYHRILDRLWGRIAACTTLPEDTR